MNKQYLVEQIRLKRTFLCVGLDTDLTKVPPCVLDADDEPIFTFNKAIIDATAPYCVAYKPNLAFYEPYGLQGWEALARTAEYLRENYPDHFLIADAKRGDIGNTSRQYARAVFEDMDFDAVTVAPYMGEDSVIPFLDYDGRWVVLLALTSNRGSQDFQLMVDDQGERLFERVLRRAQDWASEERMMFVVGATQGRLFEDVRRIVPHHFLLVPGVGAQGGSLEDVCRYGMTPRCGLLVNSSRGIIYADHSERYAEAAAEAAKTLQSEMDEMLKKYSEL